METSIITTSVNQFVSVFGSVWDLISSNPVTLTLIGGTLIGAAIAVFSRMKRAANN